MKKQYNLKLTLLFTLILSNFYTLKAQNWNEIIKATASDAAADDQFGVSVSISGNKAIVGADANDDNGSNSGTAYIFELVSGTWSETAKITASDAAAGNAFGHSVSMSGDKAIISAVASSGLTGAAYIFDLVGGTWSETAKITASDAAVGDAFGNSVSISGNKAILGAHFNDDNGNESGAAYIFELVGGIWSETAKITASDAAANDLFGNSVSISGNKAIIGAYFNDDNGSASGSAYIFDLVGGTWSETAKITASDAATGDSFGNSVDISGNKAIIGAPGNSDNGSFSGSTYIFDLVGGTWSETVKIIASDAATGDSFGQSVSISGDKVIVGANQNDDNGSNSGAAYIFDLVGATWSETTKITASDAGAGDSFGFSVSISGNNAISAAIGDDHNGTNSGSTYIFELCLISSGIETALACDSYIFNGINYTANNNTAKDTLTNAAGCDSIVTLNLTINSSTGAEIVSACDSYLFNGIIYTTNNNTAKDTLTNVVGCDSIVTLNLTINNNTGIETATACDSYIFNGITYTTNNNTALDTLISVTGCDSIITLNLTINNSNTGIEIASACDSYVFNGITYTSNNNTAKDTLTNVAGCDSILTLDLIVSSLNALTVNVSNDTLTTASQLGATYQWIDCADSSVIIGATSSMYIAAFSGDYAVIVTIGICSDTSTCSNVIITDINSYPTLINPHQLYPNPTNSEVTIANFNASITNITIIDITGKIIESFQPKTATINLRIYDKGIYFVRIQDGETSTVEKIIKQ